MITPVAGSAWRLRSVNTMTGRIVFAVAPTCPDTAHVTLDCDCKAFRSHTQALKYIEQRDDSVA